MRKIANSRAFAASIPAASYRAVAPSIQLSNTSAVAWRSGSLLLATSSATVSIGQASA